MFTNERVASPEGTVKRGFGVRRLWSRLRIPLCAPLCSCLQSARQRAERAPHLARVVARVHRDETAVVAVESDLFPKKLKAFFVCLERIANGHDLLRNDRQDFNIDAVELIEARPCSSLRQPRKEFLHHLIIEAVRAVEDNDWHCKRLAEVFDTFRLASARRTRWSTPQQQVESTCQRYKALVCQGRDDKARHHP